MNNVTLACADEQPQAHRVIFFLFAVNSSRTFAKVGKMNCCKYNLLGNPLRMMDKKFDKTKWINFKM